MSVKVIKSAKLVGMATGDGVSFPESDLLRVAHTAYGRAQEKARAVDGATTGPARVYVVVEQDVIVHGD